MISNIDEFNIDIFREDRKRDFNSDVADIFQQLSFDLIYDEKKDEDITFHPFKTAGKDGSIDHYGYRSNGDKIIIECKKNNTLKNATSALTALETKLKKSLADPKAKTNLYKPWFDTNFKEYYYTTSASIQTGKDLDNFKDSIKNMFNELSNINGLNHLKNVTVVLYEWNKLSTLLQNNTFYYHKWIGIKTIGVYDLEDNPYEKSEYRKNLYDIKLPFISRETYNQENPSDLVETETDIFDKAFTKNSLYDGILLSGKGGVGKTRLMLELGHKAKKEQWIVLRVTKNLKDLNSLDLVPQKKYCLIFDYIEENSHFTTDILDNLKELYRDTTVKIIANCRSSYLMHNDIPKRFEKVDLSSNEHYLKFVTKNILKDLELPDEYINVKPSFAVFIKDDISKNRLIHRDFKEYLQDRLCRTLDTQNFSDIKNKTFATLASLSFRLNDNETLKKQLKPLERDGWLTNEESEYISEHDTIIDELIERYLDQPKFTIEDKRDEIDKLIKNTKNLFSTYRTLDRISEWLFENNIVDYSFFANKIKAFEEIDNDLQNFISKTSLIDEKNRFEIFVQKRELYQDYIENFLFLNPISFAINQEAKKNISIKHIDKNIDTILNIWLDSNIEKIPKHNNSYRILSTVLKAYGLHDKIKDLVISWLKAFPLEMETSFVLQSWLDAGGDKELVKIFIEPWLKKFPLEMEASFVLQSWLDEGGDKELVKIFIEPWLKKFPLEMEASFVLQSWLDEGGDKELVKTFIAPWLKKFPLEMETHFIIKSWLDAEGDKELVEVFITPWLKKFPLEMETSFVLKSWLDTEGDKELVEVFIAPWIKKFPLEMETSFVLKSWLDAEGDKELVEVFIAPWIKKFIDTQEASFIIKAYLEQNFEISKEMLELLYQWIITNKENNDIDFVLKRIFKIKKIQIPDDTIKVAFLWCKKNIQSKETLFMLSYIPIKYKRTHPYLYLARNIMEIYMNKLTYNEILPFESIIYSCAINEDFIEDDDNQLLLNWVLSDKSFDLKTSKILFFIQQDKKYYFRLKKLLQEKNIEDRQYIEKLDKFFYQSQT